MGSGPSTARGMSIRTTSAPRSPSSMPQNGPGPRPPIVTIRTPCSGPLTAVCSSRERSSLRPLLPPRRGVVGGVAEYLVAVLQLQRRVESGRVGVDLQCPLRQLHPERRQFGDRGRDFDGAGDETVRLDQLADKPPPVGF